MSHVYHAALTTWPSAGTLTLSCRGSPTIRSALQAASGLNHGYWCRRRIRKALFYSLSMKQPLGGGQKLVHIFAPMRMGKKGGGVGTRRSIAPSIDSSFRTNRRYLRQHDKSNSLPFVGGAVWRFSLNFRPARRCRPVERTRRTTWISFAPLHARRRQAERSVARLATVTPSDFFKRHDLTIGYWCHRTTPDNVCVYASLDHKSKA